MYVYINEHVKYILWSIQTFKKNALMICVFQAAHKRTVGLSMAELINCLFGYTYNRQFLSFGNRMRIIIQNIYYKF